MCFLASNARMIKNNELGMVCGEVTVVYLKAPSQHVLGGKL